MAVMGGSIARRYAKALFGLGVAEGTYDRLGQELDDLARTYDGSADLRLTPASSCVRNQSVC